MRLCRNDLEYNSACGNTQANAEELVKKVKAFAAEVEAWIDVNSPTLRK